MIGLGHAIPELPSLDVEEALRFYVDRLGFTELFRHGEDPVRYGAVRRGDAVLHLWLTEDPHLPQSSSCRIPVDDIDALYAEYLAVDAIHPNGPLVEQPWGTREFVAVDGDGNALRFFLESGPA
jgi:catechol 2,3-dioxygenase-like lactoylglutathione lyase family enzyme